MSIVENEHSKNLLLQIPKWNENSPISKEKYQELQNIFEQIIAHSGKLYAPPLAQCKRSLDLYINNVETHKTIELVRQELSAQSQHAGSAITLYQRRFDELERKLLILQKKKSNLTDELENWKTKSFKLKVEPDVVEFEADTEERNRFFLSKIQPDFTKIPGLKPDRLSLEYAESVRRNWENRLKQLHKISNENFVPKSDHDHVATNLEEQKNQKKSLLSKISTSKSKIEKMQHLLAKLKKSTVINATKTISTEYFEEDDSILLKFWSHLNAGEDHMKAVSLAVMDSRFHQKATAAVFMDYDRTKLNIDVLENAKNRETNGKSTSYQFLIALVNLKKDVDSELADIMGTVLREEIGEDNLKKCSYGFGMNLVRSGIEKDGKLGVKIFQYQERWDDYFRFGGDKIEVLKDVSVTKETWIRIVQIFSTKNTAENLDQLQKLYIIHYKLLQENKNPLTSVQFLEAVECDTLLRNLVQSLGGYYQLISDDCNDWDKSTITDPEMTAALLTHSLFSIAWDKITEAEKMTFDFYQ